jgi:phage I-like protein
LTLATCDNASPPGGDAPEWVHLLPAGNMQGRDGRAYSLPDPAGLIFDFQERGIDLPVDDEHQNDKPETKLRGPVPAAGWIKELAHNASGLWGRVEGTATARQMISRREYRYLSPSFWHNRAGQIMRLKGAGLVHRPNLHLKALASREAPMIGQNTRPATPSNPEPSLRSPLIARLMQVLNLAPDATEEEALDALEAWLAEKATMSGRSFRFNWQRYDLIGYTTLPKRDRGSDQTTPRPYERDA